jgi:hypothetical protein
VHPPAGLRPQVMHSFDERMRGDQIAYAIIFAVPFLAISFDWYVDSDSTERFLKHIRWPWCAFTLAWVAWQHQWGALAILAWLGLAMFLQPAMKGLFRE